MKTKSEQRDPAVISNPQMDDQIIEIGATKMSDEGKPDIKPKVIPSQVTEMMTSGIPVRKAIFHRTVIFNHKTSMPETCYFGPEWSKDAKANKVARMWLTPYVLLCEQKGEFKFIPLANVSDITL